MALGPLPRSTPLGWTGTAVGYGESRSPREGPGVPTTRVANVIEDEARRGLHRRDAEPLACIELGPTRTQAGPA
jgi:hypothetical protein